MVSMTGNTTFLVSGAIGEDARELLYMVLRYKTVEFGNLHISGEDGLEGDIAIYHGLCVVAAKAEGWDLSDWDALKLLLSVKSGRFRYVEYKNQLSCPLKSNFKVRLTDLITLWSNLPARAEQMKCGRASFNRMRAYSAEPKVDEEPFFVEWTKAGIRMCLKHQTE